MTSYLYHPHHYIVLINAPHIVIIPPSLTATSSSSTHQCHHQGTVLVLLLTHSKYNDGVYCSTSQGGIYSETSRDAAERKQSETKAVEARHY